MTGGYTNHYTIAELVFLQFYRLEFGIEGAGRENKVDPLGFEPRAFRMQSERDTTTPRARRRKSDRGATIHNARTVWQIRGREKWSHAGSNRGPYGY